MRILIVEDSDALRNSLRHGLGRSGYAVDAVGDGAEGLSHGLTGVYDVVVLDLGLPRRDGLSVLTELRRADIKSHVLILSARDQIEDRVEGLRCGADDYLVKPFSFDELKARIEALLRRRYNDKARTLQLDGITLDTVARRVYARNGELDLTAREYAMLEALCRHRGQSLTRGQLIDKTSRSEHECSENAVDVLLSGLRRKLKSVGAGELIRTRRGFGFVVE